MATAASRSRVRNNNMIDLSTCSSSSEDEYDSHPHCQQGLPLLTTTTAAATSTAAAAASASSRRMDMDPPIEISSSPSVSPVVSRSKIKLSSSEKQQARARARRWAEENLASAAPRKVSTKNSSSRARTRSRRKNSPLDPAPTRKMSSSEKKEARARARQWAEQSLPNVAAAAATSARENDCQFGMEEVEEEEEEDDDVVVDDPMSESSISSVESPRSHPFQSYPSFSSSFAAFSNRSIPLRQPFLSSFNRFEENIMSESFPSSSSSSPSPSNLFGTESSSRNAPPFAPTGTRHESQEHPRFPAGISSNLNFSTATEPRQEEDAQMTTWPCPRCTLLNQQHHVQCDACYHINPSLIHGAPHGSANGGEASRQPSQQSFHAPSFSSGGQGSDRSSHNATGIRAGSRHHSTVTSSRATANLGNNYRVAHRIHPYLQQAFLQPDNMSYEQLLERFGDGSENRGASSTTISSLPSIKIEDPERQLPEDKRQCSICLEDFLEGDDRTALPCLHGFHSGCVNRWLMSNGSCPVCKTSVS